MSEKYILNGQSSVTEFIPVLWKLWTQYKYVIVTLRFGRDRTLDQNALWFAIYKRISQMLGTGTAEDIAYWRAYCKLRCGVPIACVCDEDFRFMWNKVVLANPALHAWEAQIELMQSNAFGVDGFPVTRNFKRKEGCEYTESLVRHFEPQGVFLQDLLSEK